jgi:hypothetical protein
MGGDRVALVTVCWLGFWTAVGWVAGRLLETPGTFVAVGFFFAIVTIFAWPWVLPDRLNEWMNG